MTSILSNRRVSRVSQRGMTEEQIQLTGAENDGDTKANGDGDTDKPADEDIDRDTDEKEDGGTDG